MNKENNPHHFLGILAYGSLVDEPGEELEKYIVRKIECQTPFNVEYGRLSSSYGPILTYN